MSIPSTSRRRVLAASAAAPLAVAMPRAVAQQGGWPDKPVRLILGYPPGGAADGVARPREPRLQAGLGQPRVFDYKPGAGATLAAALCAKAAPDGYTLHLTDAGPMCIVPAGKKLPYDPLADFTPIGNVCAGGTLVVAHPSLGVKSIADLVAAAKAKPGLVYGTSGVGGAGHLAAELLQSMAGVQLTHAPYKGGNQAAADLVGGQIPLLFSSMSTAIPFVQQGKIVALGVTSATRASVLPDVPTVAEQGLPGFEASLWFGLVGPAKLPAEIVTKAHAALTATLADRAVQDAIRRQGYEPVPGSTAEFAARIRADGEKWAKVVRDAKIAFD
jgi:tripartite-type tricarboxylate transporter receptor subunit TctC